MPMEYLRREFINDLRTFGLPEKEISRMIVPPLANALKTLNTTFHDYRRLEAGTLDRSISGAIDKGKARNIKATLLLILILYRHQDVFFSVQHPTRDDRVKLLLQSIFDKRPILPEFSERAEIERVQSPGSAVISQMIDRFWATWNAAFIACTAILRFEESFFDQSVVSSLLIFLAVRCIIF
ncbi:hypothetical protein EJ08DRAFT_119420 [Tothia fuscella]|uniref:Uncharacterized protein n=1 Tax=Tothia fuscella TaxID=1048955 RepID=A0A9P4NDQ9_9PEZI|nr:hypothetical protein EJ08DRAFT_119420 [Tothia fuscella]